MLLETLYETKLNQYIFLVWIIQLSSYKLTWIVTYEVRSTNIETEYLNLKNVVI